MLTHFLTFEILAKFSLTHLVDLRKASANAYFGWVQ